MLKRIGFFAVLLATLAIQQVSFGQVSITSNSFTYSQNFDTLASSGTPIWTNNTTLVGWNLFRQPGSSPTAISTYTASDGASNAGSFYSFGTVSTTERALGGVGSSAVYFGSPATGAVAGWIAVSLTNNAGSTIEGVTVTFDGEQWRNGGNTATQTMVLEYGVGATFAGVTTWTAPGGTFNFTSPVTGSTAAAVNGNVAGLVTGLGGNLAINLAPSETLWFRWIENNDTGNDHGLAIDNFSFQVTPVPEPGTIFGIGAAVLSVGAFVRRKFGTKYVAADVTVAV